MTGGGGTGGSATFRDAWMIRARGFGRGMTEGVNGPPILDVVSGGVGWFCSEFTCAVSRAS